MGQLDNPGQAGDTNKLNINGIQFHDLNSGRTSGGTSGAKLDFHSIISGGADQAAARPAAPAAVQINQARPAEAAQPSTLQIPINIHSPGDAAQPVRPVVNTAAQAFPGDRQQVAARQAAPRVADNDEPRPPHPPESESLDSQMGNLVTNTAVIVAGVGAGFTLKNSVRKDEIARTVQLSEVTKPETLEALKNQTTEVTRLVASKSRAANAEVDKIAMEKPDAFQEISEPMPPKKVGGPPETMVYQQVKPMRALSQEELALPDEQLAMLKSKLALTDEELVVAGRAQYLRNVEKTVVRDFNLGGTTTVSAFRTRKPNIDDLPKSEMAEFEGLAKPLDKMKTLSDQLMIETTEGRLALHSSATSQITKGIVVIGASFAATRGIDRLLYSGRSQGMLTTAFDCAAPFLVLTKMSPLVKAGLMIGGHELVRAIENNSENNRDK